MTLRRAWWLKPMQQLAIYEYCAFILSAEQLVERLTWLYHRGVTVNGERLLDVATLRETIGDVVAGVGGKSWP